MPGPDPVSRVEKNTFVRFWIPAQGWHDLNSFCVDNNFCFWQGFFIDLSNNPPSRKASGDKGVSHDHYVL